MAGYKTNDIVAAMPGLLNAAAASGEDLATTSDIISDGITAFGMKASDTSHFADVMAQASANANTNISMLGESFKYVGSLAGTMGYSVEDASIALGLMANAGVKGSQGGTTLKNAIANMAAPTDTMDAVMKKYNLSLTDSAGKMKSLKSVMDMLRENMGGLGEAEQSAAASHLFGKEAMAGMLSVINASEADYNKLTSAIYSADGAAQKMADTKLDSLSGQWTILKSAVEGMNISLGEKLAPYAKQFVTWLTGKIPTIESKIVSVVDYISKHTDDIKSMALAITGVVGAVTGVSAVGSIGNSISGISKFVSAIKIVKGANVAKETAGIAKGLGSICSIGKLIPTIFSPAGLAITGSMALAGASVMSLSSLMKRKVTDTEEDLGVLESLFNTLSGGAVKSKAELQKLGLVAKDFNKNMSNEFCDAVTESTTKIKELEFQLKSLNMDNVMNQDEQHYFRQYINDFTYDAISSIKDKKSQVLDTLQKTFNLDGSFSEAESGTLDYFGQYFDEAITAEQQIRNTIYETANKSLEKEGYITDEAMNNIKDKIAEMKQLQLKVTEAQNEYDRAYAKNKFKKEASNLTASQAEELLGKYYGDAKEKRDEQITQYETANDIIRQQLSSGKDTFGKELTDEARSNLEKTLEENTANLNNAEKAYGDLIKGYYEEALKQNPNLESAINKYTGEQFDAHGKGTYDGLDKMTETYKELKDINKDGWYDLYNSKTGKKDKAYVTTQQWGDSKEVSGVSVVGGKSAGYTGNYTDTAVALTAEYSNLSNVVNITKDGVAQIKSGTEGVLTSIGQLQQVTGNDGVSHWVAQIGDHFFEVKEKIDGTGSEVIDLGKDLNNIPTETRADIKTNADSEASKVSNLISKLQGLAGNVYSATIQIGENIGKVGKGGGAISNYLESIGHHATGTTHSGSGIYEVAENGVELVVGRQYRNFIGGEKVLNNSDTKNFFKGLGQSQVYQPQVQTAGGGGNQFSFNMGGVNIQNNENKEQIIQQACQEFARQLREALFNTK